MQAEYTRFGEIEIDGVRYADDVIVAGGRVTLRDKSPSRRYKGRFGHTPLSTKEAIPWDCRRLIVGTGAEGLLPVMKKVYKQAETRGVELVVVPTPEACALLSAADLRTTHAILHVTC